jgi:hypothetical protein
MHPGERKLDLRLDPGDAHHPAARGVLGQVVQQRCPAHARFAAHHQGAAFASTHRVEEPVQLLTFAAPAPQLRGASPLVGGLRSARRRHYAAATAPRHAPPLGASRSAISIEASLDGLEACTRKQSFATPTSNQGKLNPAPTVERPQPGHDILIEGQRNSLNPTNQAVKQTLGESVAGRRCTGEADYSIQIRRWEGDL